MTAAATTAAFATGDAPGATAAVTIAAFATSAPTIPTRPTRAGLKGISIRPFDTLTRANALVLVIFSSGKASQFPLLALESKLMTLVIMTAEMVASELRTVERSRRSLDRAVRSERLARAKLEAAMVCAARAGASQREIAVRASVSQPYVHRVLAEREERVLPRSALGFLLAANRDAIDKVLGRHGIGNVVVVGSVARGEDGPDSDIDLAVEIPSDMGLIGLAKAELELSALLGGHVDLVPSGLMKPSVRSTANVDQIPL